MSAAATNRPIRPWTGESFLDRVIPPKEPLANGLIHRRDLVALGARRRAGKTSLTTDLAVRLAVGAPDFLGHEIPVARRSLLLMLEDDAGEYQQKLRTVVDGRDLRGRVAVVTREDFYDADVPIDIGQPAFGDTVRQFARDRHPDLLVVDNLAQVVCGDYNDPTKIHRVIKLFFALAREHNAAVIIPAHPRKEDPQNPIDLVTNSMAFFESIMGSSHFINGTGSLWGLHRRDDDTCAFVAGRQRL